MSASSQQSGLLPGIYFGLKEEVYHADRALSRSDIVRMLFTPNAYWKESWMNPARKKRDKTPEMIYGAAFHCLLFEPEQFDSRFFMWGVTPGRPDRPVITESEFNTLVASIKVLRAGTDADLFLRNGMPEVTIVFDYDGIRYRVRHDYLGLIITTEFKTARTLEEGYLKKEFRDRGLDIQMALYVLSRICFKEQYRMGKAKVYGNVDPAWFNKFLNADTNDFVIIFQHKTDPHPFEPLLPDMETQGRGQKKIDKMAHIYREYMENYGPTCPWPVSQGKIRDFSMIYGIAD